jgi:two-component system sensor histidine kinase VicK
MSSSDMERTKILRGEKDVLEGFVNVMSRVLSKVDIVGDSNAPSFSMGVKQIKEEYVNFKKRGVKIRFITEIVKENLSYCKELMQYVDLRHLDQVKGNMMVSESEYIATANLNREAKPITQTIYSNTKTISEQHRYFFENLWSKSILAKQRIYELEEGIESEIFDIIHDYEKVIGIINNLIESCRNEIQIILPNEGSLVLLNNIGIINRILTLSEKNNIFVKMILSNEHEEYIILKLRQFKNISILKGVTSNHGLLIIDDKAFLRMEFKGGLESNNINNKNSFDLFELAVYSNNKKSVDLFKSMFNLLWNERKIVVELENADKLQKNFINIAAHELRTPIQTITGLIHLLKSKKAAIVEKEDEIIDILARNADRLDKLTENILYKTKIENQSLRLTKEKFDIIEKIDRIVKEIQSQYIDMGIEIIVKHAIDHIIVTADKIRIYEVLSNLLNNAIQFTKKGQITISSYIEDYSQASGCGTVIVKITDTGPGINDDILSNLFTPFLTGSSFGTGLGLYICKNIIESHGGKIWAENNPIGKGATFYFSLPYG